MLPTLSRHPAATFSGCPNGWSAAPAPVFHPLFEVRFGFVARPLRIRDISGGHVGMGQPGEATRAVEVLERAFNGAHGGLLAVINVDF